MPSVALQTWTTDASARLDELEAVHLKLTGTNRGRRWGTAQLNLSLFTALTSQFQGYCRSLHDEAAEVHVAAANPAQEGVLRVLLTEGGKLDSANARSGTLGNDFNRLGFQFIPALKADGPLTTERLRKLDELTDIRNAIVHGNDIRVAALASAAGVAMTKASYKRYRAALGALASTMDRVVAKQLAALLGVSQPW